MAIEDNEYQYLLGRIASLQSSFTQAKEEYRILLSAISGKVDRKTFDDVCLIYESMFENLQKQIDEIIAGTTSLTGTEHQIDITDGIVSFASDVMFPADIITKDVVNIRSGSVLRDIDGVIIGIAKTGGRTIVFNRNNDGAIDSITDGTYTWTLSRNAEQQITGWVVS